MAHYGQVEPALVLRTCYDHEPGCGSAERGRWRSGFAALQHGAVRANWRYGDV
ncbi:hypothetical protein E4U12_006713, partial [Claviceps purpurea]